MHTFATLEQLNDYVPICLVCSKVMRISMEGTLNNISTSTPGHLKWKAGMRHVRLKTELKDGALISKHNNIKINIDIATNYISEGQDIINRLDGAYVRKICSTCDFKITTNFTKNSNRDKQFFPEIVLWNETLRYTLKGGIDVDISKNYHQSSDQDSTLICLNHKYLPPIYHFDFNKFTDLEQLNKRLKTIKIFH